MFTIMLGAFLALEPPPPPPVLQASANECLASEPLPEEYGCEGIAIGTTDAARLILWKNYGVSMQVIYRLDTEALEAEKQDCSVALDSALNPPLTDRPAWHRWVGRTEGIVFGVGVGILTTYLLVER